MLNVSKLCWFRSSDWPTEGDFMHLPFLLSSNSFFTSYIHNLPSFEKRNLNLLAILFGCTFFVVFLNSNKYHEDLKIRPCNIQ